MMPRLLLILLLLAELSAAAVLAVAMRYGRFDQGFGFYLYIAGPIAAVAIAAGIVLPLDPLRRIGTHGLLLLGCVLFALPFVWLVGTSFKYEEEIFVYPPKWVPATPGAVALSPYVASDAFPPPERPLAMDAAVWEALWPTLSNAIWQRGRALGVGSDSIAAGLDALAVRDATVAGLWQQAAGGIADTVWASADSARIIAAIVDRIDAAAVKSVREGFVRAVEFGPVTVADDQGIERPVEGVWVDAAGMDASTQSASASLHQAARSPATRATRPTPGAEQSEAPDSSIGRAPPVANEGSKTAPASASSRLVRYDLTQSPRFELIGDFTLAIDPAKLLSVRMPMRQDRSWNRLTLVLETGGRRYELDDALYLGNRRWQEFTFRLKHKDAPDPPDERDIGIWPLVPAKDQSNALAQPSRMRVVFGIERASSAQSAWRKYTGNYVAAYLASGQRWTYVLNSLYLVALSMLGQVLSCSMVAYAFARIRWPGRDALFLVLLATMMLPGQVTMIPTFVIFKQLGLYNTLAALWLPSFLGSAFFIFMLRQFMKSIPLELEEAARIDGCGYAGIYWRIILPVMKPALAAVAIFTFMNTWNDLLGPLIYINDQRLYPLSLGLLDFRTQRGAEYGMLMAASTLMTLPVIAIFFLAQRYFIQGITLTGMKA